MKITQKIMKKYEEELELNLENQFPNENVSINIEPEKDLIIGVFIFRFPRFNGKMGDFS